MTSDLTYALYVLNGGRRTREELDAFMLECIALCEEARQRKAAEREREWKELHGDGYEGLTLDSALRVGSPRSEAPKGAG